MVLVWIILGLQGRVLADYLDHQNVRCRPGVLIGSGRMSCQCRSRMLYSQES